MNTKLILHRVLHPYDVWSDGAFINLLHLRHLGTLAALHILSIILYTGNTGVIKRFH